MADERSECFKRFVWFWTRVGMRQKFHSVMAWNGALLRAASRNAPTIVYSNHSSWWDAFVDHMIERIFRLNHFSLVDQRTLEAQTWLKRIGALPIDLENPRGAVTGLRMAVDFLKEAPRNGAYPTLLLFPQGRIVPAWRRPPGFQGGLAWLAKNVPGARILPLARRFEFLREDRPQIFLYFGEPAAVPEDLADVRLTQWLESRLTDALDLLEQKLDSSDFIGAETLLRGGMAINKKWEWVQRVLSGSTRNFRPLN